jgi:cerevisin
MSLSFTALNGAPAQSDSMKQVILAASAAGMHITVAAGNDNEDACNFSPSQNGGDLGPAISVGAIGMSNIISVFSNTGKCVDVYAPGEEILSAWIGSPETINQEDGTSQATPHVAGIVATLMLKNQTLAQNPSLMKAYIQSSALTGVVKQVVVQQGDKGLLANNGEQ